MCTDKLESRKPGDDHFLRGILIWQTLNSVDSMTSPVVCEEDGCSICGAASDDADEADSRHLNCVRCEPDFLCRRCKIHLPTTAFDDETVEYHSNTILISLPVPNGQYAFIV